MVADVLTVLSFAVLCMTKIVPVIPQIGRCANYISYSRAAMWSLFFFPKFERRVDLCRIKYSSMRRWQTARRSRSREATRSGRHF